MYIFTKNDEKIFGDLKAYLKEAGLPIKTEERINGLMAIESEFENESYLINILILLDPSCDMVTLTVHYGTAPDEKKACLYEMVDRININLCTSHYTIDPATGQVALNSGMYFTDDRINKKEFRVILKQLLYDSHIFTPLIAKQIESDEKPEAIWNQFLIKNKINPTKGAYSLGSCPFLFINSKKTIRRN